MTQTQVQYWNYKEGVRHDLEMERQGRDTITESIRHNKVTEGENARHNKVMEGETNRHNLVTESQGWADIAERIRHDQRQEAISQQEANTHAYQAQTQRYQAQTQRMQANAEIALTKVKTALAQRDVDWYETNLLTKAGDAGKKLAAAQLSVDSIDKTGKVLGRWINDGMKPPDSYFAQKGNMNASARKAYIVLASAIQNFVNNSGNYQVTM